MMRIYTFNPVFSPPKRAVFYKSGGVFLKCSGKKHILKRFFRKGWDKEETSFAWAMARPGHSKKMVKEVSENCKYEKPTNKI
jgi:hypothetical protein